MSRNFIVYQSRNQLTGTLTRMYDTKHVDCPAKIRDAGQRYIAMCVEHQTIKRFSVHYDAGRAIAHVDEWCKSCVNMIAKKQYLTAEAMEAYAGTKLLGDDRFYAYDKNWRLTLGKRTSARTADQAGIFNQSAGKTYTQGKAEAQRAKTAKRATNPSRKPSAVTTRKAKRNEISKPDPNQAEVIDAKTFRKNVASKA